MKNTMKFEEFKQIKEDIRQFEDKRNQILSEIKYMEEEYMEEEYMEELDKKYGEMLKLEESIIEYENKLP